jgi:response regulator of citrate/malate metabolism
MVKHTLDHCVFLYDTYMKYKSARCRRKFQRKFRDESSQKTIHRLFVSKKKKQKHKRWVHTEEKLDDVESSLKHTPRKSLTGLARETEVSESSAKRTTQFAEA